MTSLNAKTEVLKQDVRGRVRASAQRRDALPDEFERCGTSGAKFARLAGIKYSTFANWVLQRRKQRVSVGKAVNVMAGGGDAAAKAAPLRLLEAVIEGGGHAEQPSTGSGGLVIGTARREPDVGRLPGAVGDGCRAGGLDCATLPHAMLSFAGGLKVFVALEPVDLRKNRAERDSQRAEPLPEGRRREAVAAATQRTAGL